LVYVSIFHIFLFYLILSEVNIYMLDIPMFYIYTFIIEKNKKSVNAEDVISKLP
jgi:hypothetical protein